MKVYKIVSRTLSILLIVLFVAFMVAYLLGVKPYIVMSGSMEPVLKTGSVCFVNTRAPYDDIGVEDIVMFSPIKGSMVVHRVVEMKDEGFVTKGDANEMYDGVSSPDKYMGKVLFSVPYLGYAIVFLRNPPVIACCVILIIGLLAISWVCSSHSKKSSTNG